MQITSPIIASHSSHLCTHDPAGIRVVRTNHISIQVSTDPKRENNEEETLGIVLQPYTVITPEANVEMLHV